MLAALAFAIVLPRIGERRIAPLRDELNELVPARERLLEIERQLGITAYNRRRSERGDPSAGARAASSQARRRAAEEELIALVRQLEGADSAPLTSAATRLQALNQRLDSAIVAGEAPQITADSGRDQRSRVREARALGDTIRAGIDVAATHRRKEIADTERMASVLTGLSLFLGFGAALTVSRFGKRFRAIALRLDESEQRLREIAASERAARAAVEQKQRELEHVTESRTRLMRGFTHDVKNPLGAADGFLALVEERAYGDIPAKVRDAVAKVRQSIGQALELIRKLLDIARAEAGELEIQREETDVGKLASDVVDAFSAQAKAKDIALNVELPSMPCTVETDARRVRQILGNLVSNAVKYTPAGGHVVVRTVRLYDAALQGHLGVVVSVTDDGPGVPVEKRSMLFKEFTRIDPKVAEGAGVGLAISQKIAEALGGRITFEDSETQGSRFTLHVPIDESVAVQGANGDSPEAA